MNFNNFRPNIFHRNVIYHIYQLLLLHSNQTDGKSIL